MPRTSSLTLLATLLLAGCAEVETRPSEYLDQETAVTVRAVATPFVYAHDVPALAANVRDYLSVGAVELNNMGTRSHYLAVISWTTVARPAGTDGAPVPHNLRLQLNGHLRVLVPAADDARSIGVGEPVFRPEFGYVGETWYAVTPADLRAFAAEPPAAIDLADEGAEVTYGSWQRADAALEAFVHDIPDTLVPEKRRR